MEDSQQKFLQSYSLEEYERPSLATDVALFSLQTLQDGQYRNDPTQKICVLLIRRGVHPYKGQWALPGGFLRKGETLEECMLREVKEETGLVPSKMMWIGSYSQPERDPRGWIVSHAYAGISTEADAALAASTDAAEACWFQVELEKTGSDTWLLQLQQGETRMWAKLRSRDCPIGGTRFSILENEGLAFDHGAILAEAMELLKKQGEDIRTVFAFLPEKFTLSALQKVQETLMGISHLTPNFRRKIAAFVEETEEFTEGAGHRPARLFRRKED